jgi:hypothetical protein
MRAVSKNGFGVTPPVRDGGYSSQREDAAPEGKIIGLGAKIR